MFFDRLDASAFSGRQVRGLKRGIIALAVAATLPLIATASLSANTNALSDVDQALLLLAEAQKPTDAELLATGMDQYNQGKYEEAQVSLQQIKVEGLSQADQQKLKDTLSKTESALNQRKMARAEFEAGEKALNEDKNPGEAMKRYRAAAENPFADAATKSKAQTQMAVAEASMRSAPPEVAQPAPSGRTDAKGMYKEAVNDYKAGRYEAARGKFAQLQAAGYKPGLFEKKPGDFLKDIDKKMAEGVAAVAATQQPAPTVQPVTGRAQPQPQPQPQPEPRPEPVVVQPQPQPQPKPEPVVVQPQPQPQPQPRPEPVVTVQPEPQPEPPPRGMTAREAYNLGVEEYNRGDYTAARQHFQLAQDAGYRPPLFKDKPADWIKRIDQKMAKATPAVVETTVVTNTEPTTRPTVADAALEQTARMEKARLEQRAYEAQRKVEQAQEAQRDNRLKDAYALYQEAARLDPSNRAAIDGMAQTELMVTGTGRADILQDEIKRNETRRQAIRWSFDQAVADANAAIARRDFNGAQEALDRARVAKESNPTIFSQQDLANFDSVVANTQLRLARAQETGRAVTEQTAATEAQRDAAERARIEATERRRTVQILVRTARQLIYDGQYQQAEGVLNQILAIDPTNDYAVGVKQLVSDNARFQDQRRLREKHDREFDRQLNQAEEKKIPYTDILNYPINWPDISDLRDRETRTERAGAAAGDQQAMIDLNKVLPEVRFDDAALAGVIDFMRDVTGADIAVNWSTLEAAGVNKKAPVNLRLRNKRGATVLNEVLASVAGGPKLRYTVEDGIVRISTEDEIKSHTVTRTYDIRDLLVVAPDFDSPPDFGLATSNNSGRGRGQSRGGGKSGPGSFNSITGNSALATSNTARYDSSGTAEVITPTPGKAARTADLVAEYTNMIKHQVDPDSWIDNGGKASLTYLSGGQLIVTASQENQTRVVSLLDKLREAAAIQVSIETRFLTIQRNFLEDIGVDLDFFFNINSPNRFSPIVVQQGSFPFTATPTTPTPGSIGATAQPGIQVQGSFLDDFQVNFLIRATQASIRSTTLTAPRVTVFNGQSAFVLVAQQQAYVSDLEAVTGDGVGLFNPIIDTVQTGVRLVVQPTVSADRKYVTLSLQPQVSQLVGLTNFPVFGLANQNQGGGGGGGGGTNNQVFQASVQLPILDITSVNTIVSVPDGGTLLLGGQTLAGETEVEEGVPILSKIPFIKRLFTNRSTAKDERILLILVKPTIIIQREIEQQQFPLLGSRPRL